MASTPWIYLEDVSAKWISANTLEQLSDAVKRARWSTAWSTTTGPRAPARGWSRPSAHSIPAKLQTKQPGARVDWSWAVDERVDLNLVGRRLRRWRDERNWSGLEVAETVTPILGRPFTWLDLRPMEQGEVAPDPRAAAALCEVFGKSTADLLGPGTDGELAQRAAGEVPPPPPDDRPESVRRRSPLRPRAHRTATIDTHWDLSPGQRIRRTELHDRYGGRRYGGIAPSAQQPVVMLFSDPFVGKEHGYLDRWESDDVFLYCGEGQQGDQTLDQGNGAVLHHRRERRTLRVFEGSSGIVTYAGEFEIAYDRPYLWEQAPSSGGGPMRRVVMFRLIPVA